MADNADIEQHTTVSTNGKLERIRTDRERYDGEPKYTEDSKISLEEIYDHIKMHYRKDTNCISLTSNANIGVNYGRGSYKDRYVMIKISKKEFGESDFEIKSTIIDKSNLNLKSLVIRLEFGNTSFLFIGDAETENEKSCSWEKTTVLKVGHHGSNTSSSLSF